MEAYSKKMTMLRILPKELQDALLHRACASDTTYEHFRDSVSTRLAEQSYFAGRIGLHFVDEFGAVHQQHVRPLFCRSHRHATADALRCARHHDGLA